MGHELSGVVEESGDGVGDFARGDPVIVMSHVACGECAMCRAGFPVKCAAMRTVGFGDVPGGFAELMKTRPGSVFKMPPEMSFRAAATIEPLVTGLHGLRRARFGAGETCVIMGAGPIGLVVLLWARFAGAQSIVISELVLGRREIALKMGADYAVDPRMHNPSAATARLTGSPPDVIFDCIGAPGSLAEAITYAGRGGRVAALGASMEDDGFPPATAMAKELDILFSMGLEPGEIETAIAAASSGRILTEPMISHVIGLEELPRAFAALKQPVNQTKVMLEF
jgi:(R,R)-butanediol dehydrogenase/meso-butanediol dehydrogenase/diacetyl reductase